MGWQVSSALQTVTWITLSPPTVLYLFSLIFAMSALSCICICKLSLERLCPQLQLHAFVVVIAIVNRYCCWALRAEKIIQSDRVTKITCIFYSLLYFLRAKKACKAAGSPGLLLQREKSEECERRAASSYFNHHPQFALISGSPSAKL